MSQIQEIKESLVDGEIEEIADLTQSALDTGWSTKDIMENGLFAGMDVVAEEFKHSRMFIPEVIKSAKSMQAAMNVLEPHLANGDTSHVGKIAMATVEGDLHDIGKNLAGMMMEGAGFKVKDLGIDRKTEDIISEIKKEKPDILGLSALLTTTMPKMKEIIEALNREGLEVKVIIGGAPVTEDFANKIGADAYAPNASIGTEKVTALIKE